MPYNKKSNPPKRSGKELRLQLKLIGSLSRSGMNSGNKGDIDAAIGNLKYALSLAKKLDKTCLLAKLLNNLGILHAQAGEWDEAMLSYEKAMDLTATHHGTENFLYKTLQKNICHLFNANE